MGTRVELRQQFLSFKDELDPLVKNKGHNDRATYIPWADLDKFLMEKGIDFKKELVSWEGKPWLDTDRGVMVHVRITIEEHTEDELFAVRNKQGKHCTNPTTADIYDNIQRAYVKCFAKFGLGLDLWTDGFYEEHKEDRAEADTSADKFYVVEGDAASIEDISELATFKCPVAINGYLGQKKVPLKGMTVKEVYDLDQGQTITKSIDYWLNGTHKPASGALKGFLDRCAQYMTEGSQHHHKDFDDERREQATEDIPF